MGMLELPDLYHWSPRDRRKGIERSGLLPGRRPVCSSVKTVTDGREMICLATSPMHAWALSAEVFTRAYGLPPMTWDLWQVSLVREDEVHVRPFWGPRIWEVRVANRIPKRRVMWVGEREATARG